MSASATAPVALPAPAPASAVPAAQAEPLLRGAQAMAKRATPAEERLLFAIDAAMTALASYDAELALEMTRQYEARVAFSGEHRPGSRERAVRQHPPLKSERQSELEQKRRECKDALSACIHALAGGRMYSEGMILSAARSDGATELRNPQGRAIRQADLEWALCSMENHYARRAFWLRYRGGFDNEEIARTIGSVPSAIGRLCNSALRHAHRMLNEPIVSEVRAHYFNIILQFGLEFPEYAELRHQRG